MSQKPHVVDWTNTGLSVVVLGVIGYLSTTLDGVKTTIGETRAEVGEMRGDIKFETGLVKELKEDYEGLDARVEDHELRLALLESTGGGDIQR